MATYTMHELMHITNVRPETENDNYAEINEKMWVLGTTSKLKDGVRTRGFGASVIVCMFLGIGCPFVSAQAIKLEVSIANERIKLTDPLNLSVVLRNESADSIYVHGRINL